MFLGELFVRAFAGKDATDAFLSYHRRNFPHHLVKEALMGSRAGTRSATFDKDYLELCAIIEKILPRHKSFAPPSYYAKIFLLLGAALALEVCPACRIVSYRSTLVMAALGVHAQESRLRLALVQPPGALVCSDRPERAARREPRLNIQISIRESRAGTDPKLDWGIAP